jgi:hypothetical protein
MMKFDESATAKWLRHTLPRFDVLEDVLILEKRLINQILRGSEMLSFTKSFFKLPKFRHHS